MNPVLIMTAINATIELAKGLKEIFKKESKSDEEIKQATQRDLLEKLAEQIKANKEMIEKQNAVLIRLGENCEQVALLAKESQKRATIALIVAVAACIMAVVVIGLAFSFQVSSRM